MAIASARQVLRFLFVIAVCWLTAPVVPRAAPLAAQGFDARILPPGTAGLQVGTTYTHFRTRFSAAPGAGTEPITADFNVPLTGDVFPGVELLEAELNRFFASPTTGDPAFPISPGALHLGDLQFLATADNRDVPVTVMLGIARRINVGVRARIWRDAVTVERLFLGGGTIGLNPSPAANRMLLASIDPGFAALGELRYLPLAGTPAGQELQRRVQAATGAQLALPAEPVDIVALQTILQTAEFGAQLTYADRALWRFGDTEALLAFQFANTAPGFPYPAPGATGYRGTVEVSARMPTGSPADPLYLFHPAAEGGHSGVGVRVTNDLFLSDRLWGSASVRYEVRFGRDVERRVTPPELPFAPASAIRTLGWEPGRTLELEVSPRFRLHEAISLGVQYNLVRRADDVFRYPAGAEEVVGMGSDPVPAAALGARTGGSAHRLGGGIHFTSLPGVAAGLGTLPFEIALGFQTTVAGSPRVPAARLIHLQATLFPRLWGQR